MGTQTLVKPKLKSLMCNEDNIRVFENVEKIVGKVLRIFDRMSIVQL